VQPDLWPEKYPPTSRCWVSYLGNITCIFCCNIRYWLVPICTVCM